MAHKTHGPKLLRCNDGTAKDRDSGLLGATGAADVSFVEGAIVRITLQDFLTYDNVEVRPGPHLNVIIGANATGKSSLVNAICLGLAGHQSILGRAQQPSSFIKHGKNHAVIYIELYSASGKNYEIQREILKNGQSNWAINSKSSTMKAVSELVKKLNIQVGNLCQFLPQDRVADFVKMTKQELFDNTQKAVDEELYEMHQKLKKACQRACELRDKYTRTAARLDTERQHNTQLEHDVRSYEEREKYLNSVKLLKMKRPWVEYEDHRKRYIEEKLAKEDLEGHVKRARSVNAPKEMELQRAKAAEKEKIAATKEINTRINDSACGAQKKAQSIDDIDKKIEEIQDQLAAKHAEEKRQKTMVHDIRMQIEALQEELDKADDNLCSTPLMKAVTENIMKLNRDMGEQHEQQESIKAESQHVKNDLKGIEAQLNKIRDVDSQKLDVLRRKDRDTHAAILWLRENKDRFKKTIHEPPTMTLILKDNHYAKFVETHIPLKDMKIFVCEDPDDLEQFFHELRDNQNLCINAALVPRELPESFQPRTTISSLCRYGFTTYLRETFEAPPAVMSYLCRHYHVHSVPVGGAMVNKNHGLIASTFPDLRKFYSEDTGYSVKYSRYGSRNMATTLASLRRAELLVNSTGATAERQLAAQLQTLRTHLTAKENSYEEARRSYSQLSRQMEGLRNEKKELVSKQNLRRTLEERINQKKQSLDRFNQEVVDIESEGSKVKIEIKKLHDRKLRVLQEMAALVKQCHSVNKEKVVLSFEISLCSRRVKRIEGELRDDVALLSKLERDLDAAREHINKTKDKARQLMNEAKKACGMERPEGELKSAFDHLPATLEEIDATISDEQARADLIYQTDPQIIQQYNERKCLLEQLDVQRLSEEKDMDEYQQEIDEVKEKWRVPVKSIVEKVNKSFSHFFASLGCAGEVELAEPSNPEDYDAYGISIRVKYGDNKPMKELTTWQSGGERSVATVLYMLALQELSRAPFRCVDEINQGMDADNERKVFELVVKSACRHGTPQYFLLTPKLLPDLHYTDRMTVLCVHNGPYLMEHKKWNVTKFIARQRALDDTDNNTLQ